MAKKFLVPIDLAKNSLLNAALHPTATAPTSPVTGQFYFDTGDSKVKVYGGSAWLTVGNTTEEIQDIVGAQITAGTGVSVSYDDAGAGAITVANTGVTSIAGTTGEVDVSGSTGSITISLPATVSADISGNAATATKLATSRTIELSGDVTGSASFDGSANATITATIAANSVALGTDTTGDYVASVSGTANEIEVTGTGEGASVTIGLPDNVTIGNNLTVTGNLTVSGTTTSVNTETINLADNIITLNSNATGSPTENAGIEIERGTADNVALRWNEANDKWELTSDGTTYSNITTAADISSVPRKYAASVGDGAATSINVDHNLGTTDVQVQVFEVSSGDTVECDVTRSTTNRVVVAFATAPTSNQYRVVVIG